MEAQPYRTQSLRHLQDRLEECRREVERLQKEIGSIRAELMRRVQEDMSFDPPIDEGKER